VSIRPSLTDLAWHMRAVPATHLGHGSGILSETLAPTPGTFCGQRGGPRWVPGVNAGPTVWWCNACMAVYNEHYLGEEGGDGD